MSPDVKIPFECLICKKRSMEVINCDVFNSSLRATQEQIERLIELEKPCKDAHLDTKNISGGDFVSSTGEFNKFKKGNCLKGRLVKRQDRKWRKQRAKDECGFN